MNLEKFYQGQNEIYKINEKYLFNNEFYYKKNLIFLLCKYHQKKQLMLLKHFNVYECKFLNLNKIINKNNIKILK